MYASITSKLASTALLSSMALHATAGGSFYLWVVIGRYGQLPEIELTSAPLVPHGTMSPSVDRKEDEWVLIRKRGKFAMSPEQKQALPKDANVCQGNCRQQEEGFGESFPASTAARKPKWMKNFITARDYPLIAKQQGRDGRVVLSVVIDSEGRVSEARVISGSYDILNEVALAKVKDAVFLPAYNNEGQPIACKVRLPIRFELK